jgi:hypothetical protein
LGNPKVGLNTYNSIGSWECQVHPTRPCGKIKGQWDNYNDSHCTHVIGNSIPTDELPNQSIPKIGTKILKAALAVGKRQIPSMIHGSWPAYRCSPPRLFQSSARKSRQRGPARQPTTMSSRSALSARHYSKTTRIRLSAYLAQLKIRAFRTNMIPSGFEKPGFRDGTPRRGG